MPARDTTVLAAVRALAEADWQTLRRLRLAALEDAPDAFGPSLADAEAQPEVYWRGWSRGRPGRLQAWAALRGDEPIGLISAGVREDGVAHFGALWVAPDARGSGMAERLVGMVCAWAASHGCKRIELDVTDGNPAERLYHRLGFERTGARKPLRPGSPLEEVTMSRDLPFER